MLTWRVRRSTEFDVFRQTIKAVNQILKLSGIQLTNPEKLHEFAEEFKNSRDRANPLYRRVLALDALGIEISKPGDQFSSRNHFCRNVCTHSPYKQQFISDISINIYCSNSRGENRKQ